ncbi:MAG: epoxyqueuosine reductase [Solirubrobacterales bacterium]
MKNKYRRFSYLTDLYGIKTSFLDMFGIGFPKQAKLNKFYYKEDCSVEFDEVWFIKSITEKATNHPLNRLEYPFQNEKIFDEPIIGFVNGNDPIFQDYKKVIGPQHFTTEEIMRWQANNNNVEPPKAEELTVISFILPISEKTIKANADKTDWLSERWAQTRKSGEIFTQVFVREIVSLLMEKGVLAIAPDMTPMFRYKRYPNVGWSSSWSHRHIAYAAGLGTFGMHNLLITEKGVAHRCGSFVVNLKLNPSGKREKDIHAHCLHYQGISCLKCMQRCPAGAISVNGHNKECCYKKVISSIPLCNKEYHIFIYGCGLCSAEIPCESSLPIK